MTPTRIFAAVVALDVLGVIAALATELADFGSDIVVVGTSLSAPFTFVAAQGLAVLAATRYRAGGVALALLCTISIMSGFFDGSFSDADLTAAHRALQVALGIATVSLGAVARRTAVRPRRPSVSVGGVPARMFGRIRRSVAASPRRTDAVLAVSFAAVSVAQVLIFPSPRAESGSRSRSSRRCRSPFATPTPSPRRRSRSFPWLYPTDGYLVLGYVIVLLMLYAVAVQVDDLRVVVAVPAFGLAIAIAGLIRNDEGIGEWLSTCLVLTAPWPSAG